MIYISWRTQYLLAIVTSAIAHDKFMIMPIEKNTVAFFITGL